jgi:predicted permease
MLRFNEIWNRSRGLFRRDEIDRELDEEMRFHVEMRRRENVAAGMSERAALRAAHQAFGSRTVAKEDSRQVWSFALLETLLLDLRYGARMLWRSPVFTGATVLTLALGIGANTAIFTLLDAVVLRRLPVERPSELYVFGTQSREGSMLSDGIPDRDTSLFSYPLFQDFREHTNVFSDLSAVSSYSIFAYLSPGDASAGGAGLEMAETRLVSGDFFQTLGVPAALGRTIGPDDNRVPGGHPVAVLSHAFWARHFGSSPDVVGRPLRMNGTQYTVIGITPPDFRGVTAAGPTDIWVPLAMQAELERADSVLADRNAMWLRIIGRLPPAISPDQAEVRTNDLFRRLLVAEAGMEITPQARLEIERLSTPLAPFAKGFSRLREYYSRPLLLLMGVVGLVLLIACANVGNLLLARASSRQREVAVRLALGSSRRRLVRQLLTESLLLALLGGAAGLLVAGWIVDFLLSLIVAGSHVTVGLDPRVLLFTFGVSVLTALLFGLVPARRAACTELDPALRSQNVIPGEPLGGFSLRRGLVISQVALSLILLVVAGLFLRSLQNLRRQELGFRPEGVLVASIDPQGAGYAPEQLPGLYRDLAERLEALPGVEMASFSNYGLLTGSRRVLDAWVSGYTPGSDEKTEIEANIVTPGYLETIGAPLLAGREPDERDREGAPKVALVNQAFARHYFGGQSPLGKRFGVDGEESREQIEIVGVVGDLKVHDLWSETPRLAYFPAAQQKVYLFSLLVRSRSPLSVPLVRDAITEVAPNLPVLSMRSLEEQVERTLRQERMLSQLTGFFGLLALVLAAVGLYGVLAYGVSQRTNEIGIRMALGAEPGRLLRSVLGTAMAWVGIGIAIGLSLALAVGRLLSSLLFGLDAIDPATLLLTTAVLFGVATLAAYAPARRASRLDPVRALRYE